MEIASTRKKYLGKGCRTLKDGVAPSTNASDSFLDISFELKQFALLAISKLPQLERCTHEKFSQDLD